MISKETKVTRVDKELVVSWLKSFFKRWHPVLLIQMIQIDTDDTNDTDESINAG